MASIALSALVFLLSFSSSHLASAHVVEDQISCLDCTKHQAHGVGLVIKCDSEKPILAVTDRTGSFKAEITTSKTSAPLEDTCYASLLGPRNKLCSFKNNQASKFVKSAKYHKDPSSSYYALFTPLSFSSSDCVSMANRKIKPDFKVEDTKQDGSKSSKTIDLPVPREWGLAPTSYYFYPIIPIGIP
ncbi:uncharacterized protein LOC18435316 [Amborella trichopoda]|uniref:Pollen Ole e 1 allergen and extensin family protein n=1 Tax=Amborella trichopoda TaxID=13333 RepID=W1PJ12_AMBTC|nr:uncharacterized protein LOC18435316 [Amborella trichopoda]ERN07100.1 hypothetical protein AMTR_s00019p00092150 [Amborella trichopoda]|eukprot:XP_006845425.1 uncharacterized protein LOC18435316 [Amborella trichopoda]